MALTKVYGIKFTPEQIRYLRHVQDKEKLGGLSQTVKRMVDLESARSNGWRKKR